MEYLLQLTARQRKAMLKKVRAMMLSNRKEFMRAHRDRNAEAKRRLQAEYADLYDAEIKLGG